MRLIKSNNNFRFLLFQSPHLKMEIPTGSTCSELGSEPLALVQWPLMMMHQCRLLGDSYLSKYSQDILSVLRTEIVVLDNVRNSTNFFRVKLRFGNMFSIACKKKTIYSSMS